MQPKVSVIVPVYKVEAILHQCLDSLVNQTLEALQIILVDDGSPDRSGEIADQYAQRYDNIECYHKPNGGSSSARNLGLEKARGEYIAFLDSDDWVEPDTYERLFETADANGRPDIIQYRVFEDEVAGSYNYIFPRAGFYDFEQMKQEIFPSIMPRIMPDGNYRYIRWSNCIRFYKRELMTRHGIRYREEIKTHEDFMFNLEAILCARSYYYCDSCFYHVVPCQTSKSRNYHKKGTESVMEILRDVAQRLEEYEEYDFRDSFCVASFYFWVMCINNELRLKNVPERLKQIQKILDHPLCREAVHAPELKGLGEWHAQLLRAMKTGSAAAVVYRVQWRPVLRRTVKKLLRPQWAVALRRALREWGWIK